MSFRTLDFPAIRCRFLFLMLGRDWIRWALAPVLDQEIPLSIADQGRYPRFGMQLGICFVMPNELTQE